MMSMILFLKHQYKPRAQQEQLALAVSNYAKAIASKFAVTCRLPYDEVPDLQQDFCRIYFEKVIKKKDIKCDPASYLYVCCQRHVWERLRNKRYKFYCKIQELNEQEVANPEIDIQEEVVENEKENKNDREK